MNILTEYLYEKKEQGVFDEFSEEHFLMRAMEGDLKYFQNSRFLFNNIADPHINYIHCQNSFLMNFNRSLKNLKYIFSDKEIDDFIRNQLSAGKENYSEDQFFRAYSEINILNYLYLFTRAYSKNVKAIYEPPLGENGANPEARFLVDDDIIIDVEVKTPGFSEKIIEVNDCLGTIRPNSYLTKNQFKKMLEYTKKNNIKCLLPDIEKLVGFIKDSARKFNNPYHAKHFNILFINWTYTELPTISYNEPISLLTNNMAGIFKNISVQKALGLSKSDLSKFSAVIVYFDNVESIITGDFRRLYLNNKFRIIINENIAQDWDVLLKILQLKNHKEFIIMLNDDIGVNMLDYCFSKEVGEEKISDFCREIYDILFSDLELYKGLFCEDMTENELQIIMQSQRDLVRSQV